MRRCMRPSGGAVTGLFAGEGRGLALRAIRGPACPHFWLAASVISGTGTCCLSLALVRGVSKTRRQAASASPLSQTPAPSPAPPHTLPARRRPSPAPGPPPPPRRAALVDQHQRLFRIHPGP